VTGLLSLLWSTVREARFFRQRQADMIRDVLAGESADIDVLSYEGLLVKSLPGTECQRGCSRTAQRIGFPF
jgi:hypothetical protein